MDEHWWIERLAAVVSTLQWLKTISWTDWLQAMASAFTVLLGPTAATRIFEKLRFTYTATCMPVDADGTGRAQRWNIWFSNRRKGVQTLEACIYSKRAGNRVVFARAGQESDGGVYIEKLIVEECALSLNVSRFAPNRRLGLAVTFLTADIPQIHCADIAIDKRVVYGFSSEAERSQSVAVSHLRMTMLLLQFIAAFAALIIRLCYLGFNG